METQKNKFYYGWVIVVCAALCYFFGQIMYTNVSGAYTAAITAEFNWPRASFTLWMTISAAVMTATSPVIGKLSRKFGVRNTVVGCLLIQTLGYLGFSFSSQLWQFYCLAPLLGIGFAGVIRLAPSMFVNMWFGPKLRGTAMAFTTAAISFGGLIMVNVISGVIRDAGWRKGYLLSVAINLIVMLPAFWFLVRTPEEKGVEMRGNFAEGEAAKTHVERDSPDMDLQQIIRTPEYYLMFVGQILIGIAATGLLTNVQMYYTDIGMDPAFAALLTSLGTAVTIGGKFLLAFVNDRLGVKVSTSLAGGCYAVAFLGLFMAQFAYGFAAVYLVGYSIGSAITVFIPPIIVANLWGQKYYAENFGAVNLASGIGSMVGPTAVALVYDLAGSYSMAWIVLCVMLIIVGSCFLGALLVAGRRAKKAPQSGS